MLEKRPRPSAVGLSTISALFLAFLFAITLFAPGCRDEIALPIDRNQRPETVLTGAPGDSQTSVYRVHLHWNGFDPDGEVVAYEWAVTESLPNLDDVEFRRTDRTDSIFAFQVEVNREVLGHRFYVRAIDNENAVDETPAYTFFAARNTCVPRVIFTRSFATLPSGATRQIVSTSELNPSDTIPAGSAVTFAWRGEDCDVIVNPDGSIEQVGKVVRFSYKLGPIEVGYIDGTLADSVATYPAARLRSDRFALTVRAVDDAGFGGLDPAVRTFVWNYDPNSWFSRILSPDTGDSVSVFYADTLGDGVFEPFFDGDTLPLTASGATIRGLVRGVDRDDPAGTGTVSRYQARLLAQGDSGPWVTLDRATREFEVERVYSGDYFLTARTEDAFGRFDASPETLFVAVNRPPRFVAAGTLADGTDFTQVPFPGEVLTVAEGDSLLLMLFAAVDPDPIAQTHELEYRYRFSSHPTPGGGQGQQSFFCPWVRDQFNSSIRIFGRMNCGDGATPPFLEGDYEVTVEAREVRSGTEEQFGQRSGRRVVRFRVEYR